MVSENNVSPTQQVRWRYLIERVIAKLDLLVSNQLQLVMYHPAVKNLEASWYSLFCLVVEYTDKKNNIKIKLLNVSKKLLLKDLNYAIDFENTILFDLVYNQEFDMPGGEPFSILIGDYSFSTEQNDIYALRILSQIAAAAFVPFVASAAPALLGVEDFSDLGKQHNVSKVFQNSGYEAWHQLRAYEDSRFIGLTLPKRLLRNPHRHIKHETHGFCFRPSLSNKDSYLWGNTAYAFATILLRAFSTFGWLGQICGYDEQQQGGYVPLMANDYFYSDTSSLAPKFGTDVYISDQLEQELRQLGFIPLCQRYASNKMIFYSNNAIQSINARSSQIEEKNFSISTMLQYLLCACRFAHYIKMIGRDKIGSYTDVEGCQAFLNSWLMNYVAGNSNLSPAQSARYPLRAAKVEIRENPSKEKGNYLCVIYLKPHFQIDEVITSLRFVTELSSGAGE